jgi:hypothetical protein
MGTMKQQTAVEWLITEVKKFNTVITREYILMLLEQAKVMEKEQTLVDYSCGARDAILNIDFVDAVKYYNETYGGKK